MTLETTCTQEQEALEQTRPQNRIANTLKARKIKSRFNPESCTYKTWYGLKSNVDFCEGSQRSSTNSFAKRMYVNTIDASTQRQKSDEDLTATLLHQQSYANILPLQIMLSYGAAFGYIHYKHNIDFLDLIGCFCSYIAIDISTHLIIGGFNHLRYGFSRLDLKKKEAKK